MELMKNKHPNLNKDVYFDTDCLSSFLLIDKTDILEKLFKGKIVIPEQVYAELDRPAVRFLKTKLDDFIKKTAAKIQTVETNSDEFNLYLGLTSGKNCKVIGKGEAICIALTKIKNGVLASNNLRDICWYVKQYNLEFITTGDILVMALQNKIMTKQEGEDIWQSMLKIKRKIGPCTFSEYLENSKNPNKHNYFPCK